MKKLVIALASVLYMSTVLAYPVEISPSITQTGSIITVTTGSSDWCTVSGPDPNWNIGSQGPVFNLTTQGSSSSEGSIFAPPGTYTVSCPGGSGQFELTPREGALYSSGIIKISQKGNFRDDGRLNQSGGDGVVAFKLGTVLSLHFCPTSQCTSLGKYNLANHQTPPVENTLLKTWHIPSGDVSLYHLTSGGFQINWWEGEKLRELIFS